MEILYMYILHMYTLCEYFYVYIIYDVSGKKNMNMFLFIKLSLFYSRYSRSLEKCRNIEILYVPDRLHTLISSAIHVYGSSEGKGLYLPGRLWSLGSSGSEILHIHMYIYIIGYIPYNWGYSICNHIYILVGGGATPLKNI